MGTRNPYENGDPIDLPQFFCCFCFFQDGMHIKGVMFLKQNVVLFLI